MRETIRRKLETFLPVDTVSPGSELEYWPDDVARPVVEVAPRTQEEVARMLEEATREGWRVLPAGRCTWLMGGGAPEVEVVLSTRNLRGIESYEPADLTFTAAAGTPWRDLQEVTGANGQWLPLDPPGVLDGTVGATVATGVAGPLRHAFGGPMDHVLGLTVVTGDGRILRWGGRVVKNVAGFDATRLTVGSWGALGIVTSVSARLFPAPEEDVTLILRNRGGDGLLRVARVMALSPLPLSSVELLDPLPGDWTGEGNGRRNAALILRILGPEPQVREAESRIIQEAGGEGGQGVSSWSRLRGREAERLRRHVDGWEGGSVLGIRMGLLPSRLETLWEEGRWLEEAFGPARKAVHVGQGVLRMVFPGGEGEMTNTGRIGEALEALRARLESAGGSLFLTHGPADLLREVGVWGEMGAAGGLVRGLKREFDPAGILAPGRFGL